MQINLHQAIKVNSIDTNQTLSLIFNVSECALVKQKGACAMVEFLISLQEVLCLMIMSFMLNLLCK